MTRWGTRAGLASLAAVAGLMAAGAAAAQGAAAQAGRPAATHLFTTGWGDNASDQLGYLTKDKFSATPGLVGIPAAMTVKQIRGGGNHAIALTTAGQVLTWGGDGQGQLGDGKASGSRPTPEPVAFPAGATRVISVAASLFTSFALTSSGQVYAWGYNGDGELGGGTTGGMSDVPVLVGLPTGTRVTAISAGGEFGLALTAGGQVYAWGSNNAGQLGNNDQNDTRATPELVSLPSGAQGAMITAGSEFALALTRTGHLLAWGDNGTGEFGNGSTTSSSVPVAVPLPLPPGVRVKGLVAGGAHSVALLSSGRVLAWGANDRGQLGDGTGRDSSRPVPVHLPLGARVRAVAAGSLHTIAVTTAGQLFGWGANTFGQVGDGSTTDRLAPVPVPVNVPTAAGQPPAHGTFAVILGSGSSSFASYAVSFGAGH